MAVYYWQSICTHSSSLIHTAASAELFFLLFSPEWSGNKTIGIPPPVNTWAALYNSMYSTVLSCFTTHHLYQNSYQVLPFSFLHFLFPISQFSFPFKFPHLRICAICTSFLKCLNVLIYNLWYVVNWHMPLPSRQSLVPTSTGLKLANKQSNNTHG